MRVLGIETSCDETAVAVVEDGRRILSNVIASQVELHARFGGIVPEVASRQHLLQITPIIRRALIEGVSPQDYLAGAVIPVDGLVLMRSTLRPQRALYAPLWRGELAT